MNSLEVMEEKIQQSIAQKVKSASIVISPDGKSLVMRHPYFNYFVKLPYFNLLTIEEKIRVQRIFHSVDLVFFAQHVPYHYDSDRHDENGYSYVVDNLRHILALPEEMQNTSLNIKFLMIASLGKMKILSKRNIDLIFAERHNITDKLNSVENDKSKPSLCDVLTVLPRMALKDHVLFYCEKSEALYYLQMTFTHWFTKEGMTIHEVIMMQEVFGSEFPVEKTADIKTSSTLSLFILSLMHSFAGSMYDFSDPLKFLFDERVSDGIIHTTVNEVQDYLTFFRWKPPGINDDGRGRILCSLLNFTKNFPVQKLDKQSFRVFFDKNLGQQWQVYMNTCYFLFRLLNCDEEKFLDFAHAMGYKLSFFQTTEQQRYDFLNMCKEYAESEDFIPASLLFSLYDLDSLLND